LFLFLIDETGKIVHIFEKFAVKEHAQEVLEAFAVIQKEE
jgi:peroxiredoxin